MPSLLLEQHSLPQVGQQQSLTWQQVPSPELQQLLAWRRRLLLVPKPLRQELPPRDVGLQRRQVEPLLTAPPLWRRPR